MSENNLAPWIRLPEKPTLSDYCALAQIASGSTPARIERTESIDDPIASAVIESLRFELEAAQGMAKYFQEELRKARGDSDNE